MSRGPVPGGLGGWPLAQATGLRRSRAEAEPPRPWYASPRSAVFLVLAAVLFIGGGRRLLQAMRSRRAVERLADPDVTPADVLAAADHGRAGLPELFEFLSNGSQKSLQTAAGVALSRLWLADQLVAEEEQGIVRRGFEANWTARRTYPRQARGPLPVKLSYGVPFLDQSSGVRPDQLEWSHRITGAQSARLEDWSHWLPGSVTTTISIDPADFPTNGPHRLVLQTRVRTTSSLTSRWEIALPHLPFSFEFDPRLEVSALLGMPDESLGLAFAQRICLADSDEKNDTPTRLALGSNFVVRPAPVVQIQLPLPTDLAHRLDLEIDGVEGRFRCGQIVVAAKSAVAGSLTIRLAEGVTIPEHALDRPGPRKVRIHLTPDPDLGWADPEIRTIWPLPLETNWLEVSILRV